MVGVSRCAGLFRLERPDRLGFSRGARRLGRRFRLTGVGRGQRTARFDEIGQVGRFLGRDFQHPSPLGPLREDLFKQGHEGPRIDAHRVAAGDQFRGARGRLTVVGGHANVGNPRSGVNDPRQLTSGRVLFQTARRRILVVLGRVADRFGDAPVGEQHRGQFVVVRHERQLFQPGERISRAVLPLLEDGRVLFGVDTRQGQAADLGQESSGEAVGRVRVPRVSHQNLGGDGPSQRMRPEPVVIEAATFAAAVAGDHRETRAQWR